MWPENNWDDESSRFLAFTIKGNGGSDIYVAFNCHGHKVDAYLSPAPSGQKWCRLVDTNLSYPKDFTVGGNAGVDPCYGMEGFSSIVLIAK